MELKEYMKVIRKRIWLIAAIVIIACAATAIKSFYFSQPIYEASAKLIVNSSQQSNGVSTLDYGSVQTNIALINSYKEIMASSAIMEQVMSSYPDLRDTPQGLARKLKVDSANDSQVMNLTVTDTSYAAAVKKVNSIAKVFKAQIPTIMKVNNVTILSEAKMDEDSGPINSSPVTNIVISLIASLILSIGLAFMLNYLDDTFKTEEDIEKELGLPTLALIGKINKVDMRSSRTPLNHKQVGEGQYAALNQ
ncbi:Wzz/FepE/Etk N-terminal domain-containing protein [Paenibacillus sp. JX-17]|uniref:Wzz/FepE/Etk N-terminal domain-containing protein n=1 Tax=Paenibacillus lacisoli TaxID=3064525 RepID=A0ABT9CHW7_9BACL|nr:Wzz/FepE/Etk N-terminal domain-containing protein [Paenibacillus sp. JX-17]MDO7907198.1 Wzz/FepE/Etk N-terminal domain-containing protein [Paenibacillus sp. JX-17]